MSKIQDVLKVAKGKGYYVDLNGNVYSKNKQLSPKTSRDRLYFGIRYFGQRETIPVHKFVAFLKFGNKIFEKGIQVRHLDGNSFNNSWVNIEIGTQSDNMMDIPKEKRIEKAKNGWRKRQRFSEIEKENIKNDRINGLSYREIGEKYNVSKSTLSYFFKKQNNLVQ